MESILDSIKKLLGVSEEYTQFDNDIIMHINTVFMNLTQIGVGPTAGFLIEDNGAIWTDFVDLENEIQLNAVKTYVYLKVKLLFDPPLSSSVVQSINNMISELEWRLNAVVDFKD
jgi:hypothetical protein